MKKLLLLIMVVKIASCFSTKEIEWVAIGDSITYLNEHLNETGNRITKGYLTMVVEKLPNIHYINQGHNGWTAGDIANNIDKLNLQKAAVYSILLGTNDWWQGRPLGSFSDYQNNTGNSSFYGSFRIIIDKLKSLNNNARIILITPMQRTDFVYVADMKNNAWGSYKDKAGQSLSSFANAINTISTFEHFKLIDLYNHDRLKIENLVKYKSLKNPLTGEYKKYPYPAYVNIPFNPLTDNYPYPLEAIDITYDGLHPSDKGNAEIADMLVKIIKKY